MQDDVLACALRVREMIKIYDPAIGRAHKIHDRDDYQVSNAQTTTNLSTRGVNPRYSNVAAAPLQLLSHNAEK